MAFVRHHDHHPYPVPLRVYDETLRVLKQAVERAKLGQSDRLAAIERLDRQARSLENAAGPGFEGFVSEQRAQLSAWGPRTVFDDKRAKGVRKKSQQNEAKNAQLRLPGLRRSRQRP